MNPFQALMLEISLPAPGVEARNDGVGAAQIALPVQADGLQRAASEPAGQINHAAALYDPELAAARPRTIKN